MNGQRDIFGREQEEAPTVAPPGSHEALPLFQAPRTMRGQLSAWAESVCSPAPIEPCPLAGWALEVTDGR